jgi:hypothetical protein
MAPYWEYVRWAACVATGLGAWQVIPLTIVRLVAAFTHDKERHKQCLEVLRLARRDATPMDPCLPEIPKRGGPPRLPGTRNVPAQNEGQQQSHEQMLSLQVPGDQAAGFGASLPHAERVDGTAPLVDDPVGVNFQGPSVRMACDSANRSWAWRVSARGRCSVPCLHLVKHNRSIAGGGAAQHCNPVVEPERGRE